MTPALRIGLIGFGEVGQILAADLAAAGITDLAVYDLAFDRQDSAPSRALAAHPAVTRAADAAAAARGRPVVICAVTAAQTLEAAEATAAGLAGGGFLLDLNSASPNTKIAAAATVEAAGGRYVEAAVMSPIGPGRIESPMLLGGRHAADFLALAAPLGLSGARLFSSDLGKAAAAKMCRSVMVKGMEALLIESLVSARRHGVLDTVVGSLSDLMPLPNWPALSRYMISRAVEHGARRAEEMREAVLTVAEAGLEPLVTAMVAERQAAAPAFAPALGETELAPLLDAILREIDRR